MNKKRDSIIFFSINIFIVFRILSYYDTKVFIPLDWRDFRIFLYITFFIAMIWAVIEYARDFMKSSRSVLLSFSLKEGELLYWLIHLVIIDMWISYSIAISVLIFPF